MSNTGYTSFQGTAMFERYTERSRRIIFFARYEASNYGSAQIEPEHLLLGFLRERRASLPRWFGDKENAEQEIRSEFDRRVTRGQRFSTSVEIPVSPAAQKVFAFAAETRERLAASKIEPEHLLVGILRVEGSLAAQILSARGLKPSAVIEQLAKTPAQEDDTRHRGEALPALEKFLTEFKSRRGENLIDFFAKGAEFIDHSGKRWNRKEIEAAFETLFAPYAKKNATRTIERALASTNDLFVTAILWKNALLASHERVWMERMSVVLINEEGFWKILLLQATPVQASSANAG